MIWSGLLTLILIVLVVYSAKKYRKADYCDETKWAISIWINSILLAIIGFIFLWNITAYRDISELQKDAPAFLESKGYTEVQYLGFEGKPVWGGFTYYQAKDTADYFYIIHVANWRGELMMEEITCLNAVSK